MPNLAAFSLAEIFRDVGTEDSSWGEPESGRRSGFSVAFCGSSHSGSGTGLKTSLVTSFR